MKLQCPCGAKYSFDITPEMAREPVKFVCPGCGFDASDFVNELVRKELAERAAASATPTIEAPPAPLPAAAPRIRMARESSPASPPAEAPAPVAGAKPKICAKHPGQLATEHCVVCSKPICPQCMELFGYVCSPLCKARADSHGIEIPFYEGQKSAVEAKMWRKLGMISAAAGVVLATLLGAWIWYGWIGSRPKPAFSVRFEDKVYSGMSKLCGREQIVFLRGGTLARYDLKTQKQIWSRELVDKAKIEKEVAAQVKAMHEAASRTEDSQYYRMPNGDKLLEYALRAAAADLQLRVAGQSVWIVSSEKLMQFDWDSGKTTREFPRADGFDRSSAKGDEIVFTGETETGQPIITRVNLASGEINKEQISLPIRTNAVAVASTGGKPPAAGLPIGRPGASMGRTLDPAKISEQAQGLSLPAKIALPAVLANAAHQEAIMAELNGGASKKLLAAMGNQTLENDFQFIPSQHGHVEFSVRLLERKVISRTAMKAPPKKSALEGDLTVTKTADVANEILNEMQRSRGGDTVEEDESRYQVTIHLPGANDAADWTGEVIGAPSVFPLKTVNVLTANKTAIVLDKANKKIWRAALTYNVSGEPDDLEEGGSRYGQGPCVERGDALYVFDQAVLTAFDLATGNARWRLPSVGVVGIFFDDKGMMYVNTTTASPDKIKYSRQIDVTDKTSAVIYKLDPKTGKTLWSNNEHGFISSLRGKFIYAVQSYDPGDDEDDNDLTAILRRPPFLRIRRINPSNGRMMWDHFQERAPLDVQFDGKSIELVFKKEVQVLRFISL